MTVAFFYDIFWVFCSSRCPTILNSRTPNPFNNRTAHVWKNKAEHLFLTRPNRVFGANVMVTVATQLNVPIKILVPLWFPQGASDFTLIGLGDIVLPGLLVAFALRVDHITLNTPSLFGGYFFYAMCARHLRTSCLRSPYHYLRFVHVRLL